jgi:ATP-dependent Clp protease ATP-binding subunit ClpB
MRLDQFTIKAQEAVSGAQQVAQESDHAEVTPLHLLSALLGETEGVVGPILQKIGADVTRLRESGAE